MDHIIKIACLSALAAAVAMPVQAAQVNTNNRLQISSDDGSFSARLRARVHADANFYDNDEVEHVSGAFLRRARIGVSGNLEDWKYEVTFDNAGDSVDTKDAMLARRFGPGTLNIGQFKVFEGLEQLTSSNDLTFMERSHVGNTVAGRQIGMAYNGTTDNIGYAVGGYNLVESSDGGTRAVNDGHGFSGRIWATPIVDGDTTVHLGLSAVQEKVNGDGERARLRPAGRSNEERFVVFDRRGERADITRVNLEAAAVMGPLALSAEYLMGNAETDTRDDNEFTVWYAQASYVFGGNRRYDLGKGRLRNPRGNGIWEVAIRYQEAENDDKQANLTTTLETFDLGVTYYANQNVRFMANYVMSDNEQNDDEANLFSMRAQWVF